MRQVACEIMRQLQESHTVLLYRQWNVAQFKSSKQKQQKKQIFMIPVCLCTFNGMICFFSPSDLQTFKDPREPCYKSSTANSLVQPLLVTNNLQTLKPSKLNQHAFGSWRHLKNTVLLWSFRLSNMIRLQSHFFAIFFFFILYPCFLIYFSEASLTLPRCSSV